MGYLYRTYIELRLKTIIENANQIWRKGHKLENLWEEAKLAMKSSSQWFDYQELEAVEEKISEFCEIDPDSDSFRYSKNYDGEPTLEGVGAVDLKHLKQVMNSISTALEGVYTAIYEDRRGE